MGEWREHGWREGGMVNSHREDRLMDVRDQDGQQKYLCFFSLSFVINMVSIAVSPTLNNICIVSGLSLKYAHLSDRHVLLWRNDM